MGRWVVLSVLCASLGLVGCQTTTEGIHSIPITRDYQELERVDFKTAEASVEQAHRVGAQGHCPYEYYSAKNYLDIARERKGRGDADGFNDYAGLALRMGDAALRKGTVLEPKEAASAVGSLAACQAEFDRVKGRYEELDRDKAVGVSPAIYAQLTATMSLAEHELLRGKWDKAAEALRGAETDIDTIWSQDVDGDGVCDMKDAAPNQPEDVDNFQDDDGAPDVDNDDDGVPDCVDKAPMVAETKNRWQDGDGAPDAYPVLEALRMASGNAALSGEAKGYLRGISELLREWPELKLHVKATARISQSEIQCLDCARACAEKVQAYLVENGLPESQLVVTFHSGDRPAGSDRKAIGRGNAWVELILE